MVLVRADAPTFADLDGHGAADDISARQVFGRGRVPLHEAFAFGVGQISAFTACAFGDQAPRAVNSGRVELDELHILQGKARPQHHRVAVASAGVGRRTGEVTASVSARRQDDHLRREPVQRAVIELPRGDASADTVVHDEVEGEVLDKELDGVAHGLTVKGVQNGVAGPVRRGAGALDGAFAVILGHSAEGALIDLAFVRTRERHAPMLQLINGGRCVTAEIFDRVLIAQPVRSLHGVVHVPAPVIPTHVAEACRNAALRCNRMTAGRKDLADAGRLQAGLRTAQGRAKAGSAGSDHNNVVAVIDEGIGSHAVRPFFSEPDRRRRRPREWRRPRPTRDPNTGRCSEAGRRSVWRACGRSPQSPPSDLRAYGEMIR